MPTRSEQETHIHFDYERDEVNFYTTRAGEANKLQKRLKPIEGESGEPDGYDLRKIRNGDGDLVAWDFTIPKQYFTSYLATAAKSQGYVEKTKERLEGKAGD